MPLVIMLNIIQMFVFFVHTFLSSGALDLNMTYDLLGH